MKLDQSIVWWLCCSFGNAHEATVAEPILKEVFCETSYVLKAEVEIEGYVTGVVSYVLSGQDELASIDLSPASTLSSINIFEWILDRNWLCFVKLTSCLY